MRVTLKYKIFLLVSLLVVGMLLATLQVANQIISSTSETAVRDDLARTKRVFDALQASQLQALVNQHQVLADSPQLKAAAEVKDPATMLDTISEISSAAGVPLIMGTDKRGALLAEVAMGKEILGKGAAGQAVDAVFAQCLDPEEPQFLAGIWAETEGLFLTTTGPIILKNKVIGGLRLGFPLDANVASSLYEQTGSHAAFVSGGTIVASSLGANRQTELGLEIIRMGLAKGDMPVGAFEVVLAGVRHVGQVIALSGPNGEIAGYQIQLRGLDQVLALLDSIQKGFLIILVSGMGIAIFFSFFAASGVTKPLASLVEATHQVEKGNLDFKVKVSSQDELGRLAKSFNDMTGQLKEKERVKALFGKYLPKAVADKAMQHQGDLKLGGEMLEITCLFSDIRGFTSMSEKMPPQDIVSMLNDYYTRMIDVLFENDGTLDKTIGDAVMAIFGAPVPDEDGPVKAVRTALGMMTALNQFNTERRSKGLTPIEIGIGVNTGQMVAGNLGSIKQFSYTVIGEEVNLAARLCGSAKAGQVLVSENTWRKVKWQFEFNKLDPIKVKNVSQPVAVYEVLGEKSSPDVKES